MYGAILGDMIGASYEFDRSKQNKDFDMFNKYIRYTDDSMMTIAVADAIMTVGMQRLFFWQGQARARMRSEITLLLNSDMICLKPVTRSVRGISLM